MSTKQLANSWQTPAAAASVLLMQGAAAASVLLMQGAAADCESSTDAAAVRVEEGCQPPAFSACHTMSFVSADIMSFSVNVRSLALTHSWFARQYDPAGDLLSVRCCHTQPTSGSRQWQRSKGTKGRGPL